MPQKMLKRETRDFLLSVGDDLFSSLGIVLTEDQQNALEEAARRKAHRLEKQRGYNKTYKDTHGDAIRAKDRRYYYSHLEYYAAKSRAYAQTERRKAYQKVYQKAYREAMKARRAAAEARE